MKDTFEYMYLAFQIKISESVSEEKKALVQSIGKRMFHLDSETGRQVRVCEDLRAIRLPGKERQIRLPGRETGFFAHQVATQVPCDKSDLSGKTMIGL